MFIIFFAIATLEIMCGVIAGHTRLVKFSQMYQMIDWWWLKVNKCIKYSVTATTLQPPIKQLCRIIVAYINFGLHVWYFCNPGMSIGMKVFNATYLYHSLSLNTPYGIKNKNKNKTKKLDHGLVPCGIYDANATACTVKPVYNDHLMGYFSAFWSSSRWPRAT